MRSLDALELTNKVVLVRADLNVPIENSVVKDANRIEQSLPTFQYVLEQGATLTIASHLGRPDGVDDQYSLQPVARMLEQKLQRPVELLHTFDATQSLQANTVYLYENTRFMAGETECDPTLAKQMAACCDVFVMDAFATAHRQHASTFGVAQYAQETCAGLLLSKELQTLQSALMSPNRPLVAVIGGAKISSKMHMLRHMLDKVDILAIVGGMANTFLLAQGNEVGQSLIEADQIDVAQSVLTEAHKKGVVICLPQDFIVANSAENHANATRSKSALKETDCIYDIGPQSSEALRTIIYNAQTVIWNGPAGFFENPLYAQGSIQFARDLAACDCVSIVGGGDSVRVLQEAGVTDGISYISTGGGAFLAYLSNADMPVVSFLEQMDGTYV